MIGALMRERLSTLFNRNWSSTLKDHAGDEHRVIGPDFVEELLRCLTAPVPDTISQPMVVNNTTNGPAMVINNSGPSVAHEGIWINDARAPGNPTTHVGIGLGNLGLVANEFVPYPPYFLDSGVTNAYYGSLGGGGGDVASQPGQPAFVQYSSPTNAFFPVTNVGMVFVPPGGGQPFGGNVAPLYPEADPAPYCGFGSGYGPDGLGSGTGTPYGGGPGGGPGSGGSPGDSPASGISGIGDMFYDIQINEDGSYIIINHEGSPVYIATSQLTCDEIEEGTLEYVIGCDSGGAIKKEAVGTCT